MSRSITFRCPDEVAETVELAAEALDRSVSWVIAETLRKAFTAPSSIPPVQSMPVVAPQAPMGSSVPAMPGLGDDRKRCPRHRDIEWAACRAPACKMDYADYLTRLAAG